MGDGHSMTTATNTTMDSATPYSAAASASRLAELQRLIGRVVKGKEEVIRMALTTLLARGHLLIEDVPGVGKTTLAQALARSFHCSFQRIQFTSDMLPSDVIGISVFNPTTHEFELSRGRFSRISSWPTKLIAPRRRRSRRCSRR